MLKLFTKKQDPKRDVRELLRENLKLVSVDMFYNDDPLLSMTKEERLVYLKSFFDLFKDEKLTQRIKYHINKQAQKTLGSATNGVEDLAGAMNINGIAFIMNDIEKLSNMYIKETTVVPEKPLDKFAIIPTEG